MHLTVRHATRYEYEPAAGGIALRLKLFPRDSDAQTVDDWTVTVNGEQVKPLMTDAAGDRIALWHGNGQLDVVEILAEGSVRTTDTSGVLRGRREAMPPAVYLRQTEITEPSPAIEAIAEGIEKDDTLSSLHALSAAVQDAVVYTPGATEAGTSAAEVAVLGRGVCQDQAHVFISAARTMGIPARYVTGYLLDAERDEDRDEQTHAWAEAHVAGLGWIGFDITHQLCPTDVYVRLATGLDAPDAAPVRGTFSGEPEQTLSTEVSVRSVQSQSQSQQ